MNTMTMNTMTKRPRNVFAEAVNATNFQVTNNTQGNLGNQSILVFLTPVTGAEQWTYAAWQQLSPGDGGSSYFTLNQAVSGQLVTLDGNGNPKYSSNQQTINPGYESSATNPNQLDPVLGVPAPASTFPPPVVTPGQSGIVNNTSGLEIQPNIQWFVNGNLSVQSLATLPDGGALSAFELNTILYWAVGDTIIGPTWTYNQITPLTAYSLPANTPQVGVSVTYTGGTFQFAFTPPSA